MVTLSSLQAQSHSEVLGRAGLGKHTWSMMESRSWGTWEDPPRINPDFQSDTGMNGTLQGWEEALSAGVSSTRG